MRTAAIPFHLDKVGSPVAEARASACGVAASTVTAAFNFLQASYPPAYLPHNKYFTS